MSFFEGLGFPPLSSVPVVINHYLPKDEVWLIDEGKRMTIHCHEGLHAGEDVEVWLRRQQAVRVFNINFELDKPEPPRYFPFKAT